MSFAAGDPPLTRKDHESLERPMGPVFVIVSIVLSVLLWSVAAFQIVFVIPRFVKIFNDFRMAVPVATQIVIDHAIWIVPTIMLATFLWCAITRSRWLWILLLIMTPILVNLAILINFYHPLLLLLEGLAGAQKN